MDWTDLQPGSVDVRLVVCDMDGTLLDGDGRIPEDFWPLLAALRGRDIAFAPASGRQYETLRAMFDREPGPTSFIAENGTLVRHAGEVISTTTVDRALADHVIDVVRRGDADLRAVVCGRRSAYVEQTDDAFLSQARKYYVALETVDDLDAVDDDVLKLAVYAFDGAADAAHDVFGRLEPDAQVVVSGAHWIDIMSPDVDKGRAVRTLQDALGVTPAQTIVFGDYLNDRQMMDAADVSVAMANGHPDLRESASHIGPANTEAGVVTVLRHLLALDDETLSAAPAADSR